MSRTPNWLDIVIHTCKLSRQEARLVLLKRTKERKRQRQRYREREGGSEGGRIEGHKHSGSHLFCISS